MTKYKQNERIPFTDDLMFSMVMRDENICRRLLERILPNEEFGEIRIEDPEGGLYIENSGNPSSSLWALTAYGLMLLSSPEMSGRKSSFRPMPENTSPSAHAIIKQTWILTFSTRDTDTENCHAPTSSSSVPMTTQVRIFPFTFLKNLTGKITCNLGTKRIV